MTAFVLVLVQLTCGHSRRIVPGLAGLVARGHIDDLHCLSCNTAQPIDRLPF